MSRLLSDNSIRHKIIVEANDKKDKLFVDACKSGYYDLAIELLLKYALEESVLIQGLQYTEGPFFFHILSLFYRQMNTVDHHTEMGKIIMDLKASLQHPCPGSENVDDEILKLVADGDVNRAISLVKKNKVSRDTLVRCLDIMKEDSFFLFLHHARSQLGDMSETMVACIESLEE